VAAAGAQRGLAPTVGLHFKADPIDLLAGLHENLETKN
jgi:hypothetical protein